MTRPVSTQTDSTEAGGGLLRRLLSLRTLREAAVIVGAYFVYMLARRFLIPDIEAVAFGNALRLLNFEAATGLLLEAAWQGWVLEHSKAIVIVFNWVYIVTFIPILVVTALVVYLRNRDKYYYYRNVWLISFVLALAVFILFPLAPPRFMPEYGFVDAIQRFGPSWYGGGEMARALYYNVYAAMPSLHFSWTLLFGVLYFRMGPLPLKVWGVLYPTMTFFAITITGNHYIMDAVGGFGVALASYASYELLLRVKPSLPTFLHGAEVRAARVAAGAWAWVTHLKAMAIALGGRMTTRPLASPVRDLLLRWKMTLLATAANFRSHPLIERVYLRLYARKWKTGLPG